MQRGAARPPSWPLSPAVDCRAAPSPRRCASRGRLALSSGIRRRNCARWPATRSAMAAGPRRRPGGGTASGVASAASPGPPPPPRRRTTIRNQRSPRRIGRTPALPRRQRQRRFTTVRCPSSAAAPWTSDDAKAVPQSPKHRDRRRAPLCLPLQSTGLSSAPRAIRPPRPCWAGRGSNHHSPAAAD